MDLAIEWTAHEYDSDRIQKLAAQLDRLAVEKDDANLRGLADAVRIVSLPHPSNSRQRMAAQRVLLVSPYMLESADKLAGLKQELLLQRL